ncbi:class I adenylate-forming enzyme family protein [Actinoallomurus sp. CA-150999]|uniref:class I adenylate-forming enzyme family protein n=1 Tax=Actinoallomurus sp. CA-150999 TaxID=3239887 RepID=UPI003D89B1FD
MPEPPSPTPLDALPRTAARTAPDRTAIRAGDRSLTFAELDEAVTRCAAALHDLLGPPGAVVALVSTLDPDFAIAYYGIVRAGHVVAVVNPLLRAETLQHVLALSGARAVLAPPHLHDRMPPLDLLLPTGSAELRRAPHAPGHEPGLDDVACLQFTSGTTGPPKGVRLSHRNLTVNAAQIAGAHGLGPGAVTLNHLPNYHPMHLNSALAAAATQVLCAAPDPASAVAMANRYHATHYYSLPVRLSKLAQDPGDLAFDTVTAVFSGGSALPVPAATALSRHFGVPVVQGYGLAETSPLTHSDPPQRPKPGSVGPAVPGTECRIVDVDSREALAAGEKGEIQLRGPQLMLGYLGGDTGVDEDGWFSTGDLGRVDPDGHLFLVDRLKDTFKCDNWLVSPAEIERVAARHPAVRDCVVFDHPHEHSGAVAHALVVLADPAADAADIAAFVNDRVPYYERIHRITAVPAIPRSPSGKVVRRDLRA